MEKAITKGNVKSIYQIAHLLLIPLVFLLFSCGDFDENALSSISGVVGDTTAPAAINDLTASAPNANSIDLSWTAPGDDGDTGTAESYDIRYSISSIGDANWSAATRVTGEPTPEASGTTQSVTVTGLAPETTYYFAIKTVDEVPNTSDISNVEVETTIASADTTAPGSINDLTASNVTSGSIELSWTAPGDDGDTGTAVSYDVRYSTSGINDTSWSSATKVTGEPTPKAAGTTQSVTVTGLAPETTYYFAIKTADEVPNVSNLSNIVAATTIVSNFSYVMGTDDYGQPTVSQPAQWETYTDPVTGLTIRRITDAEKDVPGASSACVHYVRVSPVSSDGRYLLMEVKGSRGNPYYIMDLQTRKVRVAPHATGKPYANNGGIDAQPEYRWDYTGKYPTRIYYRDGLKFYQADINYPDGRPDDPNSNILLHDFANEYPKAQVAYNDDEGDSSADSRYWAFMIRNSAPDYDLEAIITYDKKRDTIIGSLDSPPRPNFVDISPSGSKVVLSSYWHSGGVGSNFDGPHAWNLDFTKPVKVAAGSAHSGWAWDKNGDEGFLQINNAGTGDWLRFSNILTGDYFKVFYQGDLDWAGHHFSRVYQPEQKGWIFLDTYTNSGWAAGQLLAIEAIPASQNPRVWRIAYTQNQYSSGQNPMPSMSYDGTKMYYCSNWKGSDNKEIYEVTLPGNWWLDLQ